MTTRMILLFRFALPSLLALATCLAAPPALRAAPPATATPVVVGSHAPPFAAVLGVGKFFSLNNRTRIVQFCILAMCVALFIMMRKFSGRMLR